MPLEQRDRGAAAGDVHLLPPRRADSARVQLGRRVAAVQVEVDDTDLLHAALDERARDRGADHPASRDQYVGALFHLGKARR